MFQPRRRVLCAEHNEDICYIVSAMLRHEGHEVVKARTIQECLDAALASTFDLYMLDDRYTDGDGIELCRQLRQLTPETPILFFSSRVMERDRQRAVASGADAYLIKPEDIFTVVQTVNSLLGRDRASTHRYP
jgi:CheY-like chemotaxis protein